MKSFGLFLFIISLASGPEILKSQDLSFKKEVNEIDSILKENPYHEGFLGITYYYSIDISADKELTVNMDFNGPFRTTFTARIADLTPSFEADTTEYTSSICWHCKADQTGRETRCINQVNIYTTGERDSVASDDICIQLPAQTDLRIKLINMINDLVIKVRGQ